MFVNDIALTGWWSRGWLDPGVQGLENSWKPPYIKLNWIYCVAENSLPIVFVIFYLAEIISKPYKRMRKYNFNLTVTDDGPTTRLKYI